MIPTQIFSQSQSLHNPYPHLIDLLERNLQKLEDECSSVKCEGYENRVFLLPVRRKGEDEYPT